MEIQELRIGNWYRTDSDNYYQTEADDYMNWHVNGCWALPIPLTEEWLLKFGFDKLQNGKYDEPRFKKRWVYLYKVGGNHSQYQINVDDKRFILTCIDYVHQLQNLYFALTGEELKMKDEG